VYKSVVCPSEKFAPRCDEAFTFSQVFRIIIKGTVEKHDASIWNGWKRLKIVSTGGLQTR
jgi:hypothetical protein